MREQVLLQSGNLLNLCDSVKFSKVSNATLNKREFGELEFGELEFGELEVAVSVIPMNLRTLELESFKSLNKNSLDKLFSSKVVWINSIGSLSAELGCHTGGLTAARYIRTQAAKSAALGKSHVM